MFLLQILNETDTEPAAAIVAGKVRSVRVAAEAVRDVAIALSGRPAFAVDALHIVRIRAVAEACGRQEDSTCGFEFRPLLSSEGLVSSIILHTPITMKT